MKFIREYFYFTRGERNGTIILVVIMLFIFVFPYVYNRYEKSSVYNPDPEFIREVNAFYNRPGRENRDIENKSGLVFTSSAPVLLTDTTVLKQSQLPGESVNQKSQVSGESGMLQSNVPGESVNPQSHVTDSLRRVTYKSVISGTMIIDINTADTSELMLIRGIGPVFSRRIIKYRDILGGYHDVSQLLEVYGIDENRYLEVKAFIFADKSQVVKLCPLTDEFGVLLRHPYLEYEQVSEIFRLRSLNKLSKPEDLLQSDAFNEEDLMRINPYFHHK